MHPRQLVVVALATLLALGAVACGDDDGAAGPTTVAPLATAVGAVAATELAVGDCLQGIVIGAAERSRIEQAQLVRCDGPHELEVFATFDLDPAAFGGDGLYPGEAPVVNAADAGCDDRLSELGDAAEQFGLIAIWPTAVSWSQGDRVVACAAFSEDRMPFEAPVIVAGG